jgi:hypothetical protein
MWLFLALTTISPAALTLVLQARSSDHCKIILRTETFFTILIILFLLEPPRFEVLFHYSSLDLVQILAH